MPKNEEHPEHKEIHSVSLLRQNIIRNLDPGSPRALLIVSRLSLDCAKTVQCSATTTIETQ